MKRKNFVLIGIIIAIASFFLLKGIDNKTKIKSLPQSLPKEVTIILDKDGFKPNVVNIKTDTAVRWLNESGDKQTVNSDDYPTNQLHKELNFGIFNNSSSVVYIFKIPGTYGYHNQFNPKQSGKIIVE
jgi:plastocyanin